MSNYLGIANVTGTLCAKLNKAVSVVPGAAATSVRPEDAGAANPGVNVFLYQVAPNAAYRNTDLPTRSATEPDKLLARPCAALDLHYLLTVDGSDAEQTHSVLGAVVRELHTRPALSSVDLKANASGFLTVPQPDVADDPELVRFTPLNLTLSELSNVWQFFFQSKYRLSVAYKGSVVLIEDETTTVTPGPAVQARNVYVDVLGRPEVDAVAASPDPQQPISSGGLVAISGRRLAGAGVQVLVDGQGGAVLGDPNNPADPSGISPQQLVATLPPLAPGIHVLSVAYPLEPALPQVLESSNAVPLIVPPSIASIAGAGTSVTVTLTSAVRPTQPVVLLLRGSGLAPVSAPTSTARVPADPPLTDFAFAVTTAVSGTYQAFVQVDGVESPADPAATVTL